MIYQVLIVVEIHKRSGKFCRLKPMDLKWAEEFSQCAKMMVDAGWFSLFERFSGYNVEVTKSFSNIYRKSSMNFQTLNFKVNEGSIAEATWFAIKGERWLKKHL